MNFHYSHGFVQQCAYYSQDHRPSANVNKARGLEKSNDSKSCAKIDLSVAFGTLRSHRPQVCSPELPRVRPDPAKEPLWNCCCWIYFYRRGCPLTNSNVVRCVVVRAPDLRSTGREFDGSSGSMPAATLGNSFTYMRPAPLTLRLCGAS